MKTKSKVKIIVDIAMTVILLALMACALIGEALHEWLGVSMFVLFILHNILNWKWYRNLFTGKYTVIRILQTSVNLLIFVIMLCIMVSGIILSRHLFVSLPIGVSTSLARIFHMLAAYWVFVLMSIHLGLHWNMVFGMLKKQITFPASRNTAIVFRIMSLIITVYGVFAFIKRNIGSYMFMQIRYAFFDFDEPLIFFFMDYIAIMCMFIIIIHILIQIYKSNRS